MPIQPGLAAIVFSATLLSRAQCQVKAFAGGWTYARPGCRVAIRLRSRLLPICVLGSILAYLSAPNAALLMACVTLGCILGFSAWWADMMARKVFVRREIQSLAFQVGDELTENIILQNTSHLPVLWAEFLDDSNLPGYAVSSVRAAEPASTLRWKAHAICSKRGLYELGPWELHFGDPFGVFRVEQRYTDQVQILVYPPLASLPQRLLPRGGLLGDQHLHRQAVIADTSNAMTARPYAAGDEVRRIHWPTTARQGTPFVKVFQPEAASRIWLLLDGDAQAQYGQGVASTEETAVLLASSLAATLLRQLYAVGLFAHGARFHVVPPQRGTTHLWTLLRELAAFTAHPDRTLAQSLSRARLLFRKSDLVVVITSSLAGDWPLELHRLAGSRLDSLAEVILLDPASFGGNGRTPAILSLLTDLGLEARVVRCGEIEPVAGAWGALARWEFRTLATGGVYVRNTPRRVHTLRDQLDAVASTARSASGGRHG